LMKKAPGVVYTSLLRDVTVAPEEKIKIYLKIIEKYGTIRALGIAHRDVKLDHIFVDCQNDNCITIVDFGCSAQTPSHSDVYDLREELRQFCFLHWEEHDAFSRFILGSKEIFYNNRMPTWPCACLAFFCALCALQILIHLGSS
jgi:serine/threonine protein kinase